MKIVSLYSGADNIGDGCDQAGHRIILAVEYNPIFPPFGKDACETIKLNHPDCEVINKPVSEVLSTLPKCDAVVGGPPCPEFSRAKHNRTYDLCEVNNFKKAFEITKAKHYFMENVEDLYKVHRERNFLINCADYGVPQTRIRRIFTNLELPLPTHARFPSQRLVGESLKKWVSVKEALGLTDGYISNTGYGNTQNREYITKSIDEPADIIVTAATMKLTDYTIKSTKKIRNRVVTLQSLKEYNPKWFRKHPPIRIEGLSDTVLAKHRSTSNEYLTDGKYARKLTNEELAILQGFRTDFKFYGNKGSVRKQIGNALPSIISKAFFEGVS